MQCLPWPYSKIRKKCSGSKKKIIWFCPFLDYTSHLKSSFRSVWEKILQHFSLYGHSLVCCNEMVIEMRLFQAIFSSLKNSLLCYTLVSIDFPEILILQVEVKSKKVIFTAFWTHHLGLGPQHWGRRYNKYLCQIKPMFFKRYGC